VSDSPHDICTLLLSTAQLCARVRVTACVRLSRPTLPTRGTGALLQSAQTCVLYYTLPTIWTRAITKDTLMLGGFFLNRRTPPAVMVTPCRTPELNEKRKEGTSAESLFFPPFSPLKLMEVKSEARTRRRLVQMWFRETRRKHSRLAESIAISDESASRACICVTMRRQEPS
jgi:hypothetical protein